MGRNGTGRLKAYQRARRREWLLATETEVFALEGRLGLMTEEARADFYGPEYLDPDQKLGRLLERAAVEEAQREAPRPMTGALMLGRKMYHRCGQALWVATERRGDDYATVYSDAYRPGLIENCPTCGERIAEADLSDRPRAQARKIQTSGGTVTLQGGQVVNAWCRTCKSGGLPSRINGRFECWCGATITTAAEVA